jgi:hypothetical protein
VRKSNDRFDSYSAEELPMLIDASASLAGE